MRRSWIVAGVSAAIVIVVGVVVLALAEGSPAGKPKPAAAGQPSAPAADQGPAVASALRHLADDPGSLLASPAAATVSGAPTDAVPAGSTVAPDARSWAPDGLGGGTMLVTV